MDSSGHHHVRQFATKKQFIVMREVPGVSGQAEGRGASSRRHGSILGIRIDCNIQSPERRNINPKSANKARFIL
jgi:hypothetical protein